MAEFHWISNSFMSHTVYTMYHNLQYWYIGERQLQLVMCEMFEYFSNLTTIFVLGLTCKWRGGNENPRRHIGYFLQTARRSTQYHACLATAASTGSRLSAHNTRWSPPPRRRVTAVVVCGRPAAVVRRRRSLWLYPLCWRWGCCRCSGLRSIADEPISADTTGKRTWSKTIWKITRVSREWCG